MISELVEKKIWKTNKVAWQLVKQFISQHKDHADQIVATLVDEENDVLQELCEEIII